ncbi:heat shock protein [Galdieria sulphuraria]|uniref:Heat shock protein n=1 Tax=Galdieria sulphuraria TaxID=130081 RepID=M2Y5Z4_GALSU|nr:heat shock protein [Galdieria sulphuraria]EME31398.1 heat shock protein [Galdieria sulphuraria]|eukprot:XP_005707918.1 heat shock protein [Galdieria sulphuraria]
MFVVQEILRDDCSRMVKVFNYRRPARLLSSSTRMRAGDPERRELSRPMRTLDSAFDELLAFAQDPWAMFRSPWSMTPRNMAVDQWMPRVDLVEKEDGFYAYVELPGLSRENVKVEVRGEVITISGEKKDEAKSESEKNGVVYHRMERSYGSFQRSLRIPPQVEKDKIKAVCKDGVLTVTMPKRHVEKQDAKTIEIHAE